jgi:hypothetical protein
VTSIVRRLQIYFEKRLNCSATVSLVSERALPVESVSVKLLPRLTGLAFLASVNVFVVFHLFAQSPGAIPSAGLPAPPPVDATATISFGNNQSVVATSRRGSCDRVGLLPDQIVGVAVQFSAAKSGHVITIEPLDGGQVVGPGDQLVVGTDNTISFQYQPGHDPGISQVCLHDGAQESGCSFG